jgi:hypothetical protein
VLRTRCAIKKLSLKNLIFKFEIWPLKKIFKTVLANGTGSCTNETTLDKNSYYCIGPDCNKLAGKKCWNPVDGGATTATCGNNDYQCKVKYQDLNKFEKK